MLNSSIELATCGSTLYSQCCMFFQVTSVGQLLCPCCYGDHLNDIKIVRQACYLVQDMLKIILILCSMCDRKMHLACSPSRKWSQLCTCGPCILDLPIVEPLSSIENTLQTHLVQRSLSLSPEKGVIFLKTKRVSYVVLILCSSTV